MKLIMLHCNLISRTSGFSSRYLTKLICYTMIPSKSVQMTMLRGRQRSRACVKVTSGSMISSKGHSVTFIEHGIPNGIGYLNPRIIFLYSIWQKRKQLPIWADPSQAGRIKEKHEFRWTPWTPQIPLVWTSSARLTAASVFRAVSNVETTGLPDWHSTSHIDASRTYMWRLIAFRTTQKVQGQMKKETCLRIRVIGNGVGYARLS